MVRASLAASTAAKYGKYSNEDASGIVSDPCRSARELPCAPMDSLGLRCASHGRRGVDAHRVPRGDWVGWIVVDRRSVLGCNAAVRQATRRATIGPREPGPIITIAVHRRCRGKRPGPRTRRIDVRWRLQTASVQGAVGGLMFIAAGNGGP